MVKKIKEFILARKKTIFIAVILLIAIFVLWQHFYPNQTQPQYQTAKVTKGTITVSVSESGTVAVANRTNITTQASGVVNKVFVKDGETVTKGEKIASLTLDYDGEQRETQDWAAYLDAQNNLTKANSDLYSLQSAMFTAWNTYFQLAQNSTYQNPDGSPNLSNRTLPAFTTVQDNWLAAQAAYQNQQGVIAQAQAADNNAWLIYQANSSTVTAPTSGTISNLTITPGMQVVSSGNTTSQGSTSSSSQVIATIKTGGNPVITVSLSEVDVANVKAGDRATITFDALPNQTFTGKVFGINTTGVIQSGVTTYPTTLILDLPNNSILPNMTATANIITAIKNNALLVPSAAIQTSNGQSTVGVLRNGNIMQVPVITGLVSDTQTEILSGLSEGETVVIGALPSQTGTNGKSVFSGGLRFGALGGGGAFRGPRKAGGG